MSADASAVLYPEANDKGKGGGRRKAQKPVVTLEREPIDPGPGQRLREIRTSAGYQTMEEAAIAIAAASGVPVSPVTYSQHEGGIHRRILPRQAELYAEHFNVPAGYILYGPEHWSIRISGLISTTGKVVPIAPRSRAWPKVPAPPHTPQYRLSAYQIRTDSLTPTYLEGDVVFVDHSELGKRLKLRRVWGRKCLVRYHGALRLATVHESGEGMALLCWADGQESVLPQGAIRCAPVLWVKQALSGD